MKRCLFLYNSMSPFSRKKVYGGEETIKDKLFSVGVYPTSFTDKDKLFSVGVRQATLIGVENEMVVLPSDRSIKNDKKSPISYFIEPLKELKFISSQSDPSGIAIKIVQDILKRDRTPTTHSSDPVEIGNRIRALENKALSRSISGKSAPILADIMIRKSQ